VVLTDDEFDPQITVRANLAVERPPTKVVREGLGNLPADLLGLFIADGAGARERTPWAALYL
jgi:hypothetical protein